MTACASRRPSRKFSGLLLAASVLMAAPAALFAEAPAGSAQPAIVSHIKVLSDKVEDVSSLEAWKASFIKPGMSEKEKALAVWTTVVKFRQQTSPPEEYLGDGNVHDPIKDFNVYGYGMCCCASANIESLSRYAGLEARGWGINHHSVPEVKIDGHWSLLDASLIQYFNLPDGKIAGVMEISDSVVKWLNENPQYKKVTDHNDLYKIMRKGEWKKNGPEVLKGSATYDENGWQPAHTHAWGDTILEYGSTSVADKDARKPFLIEYGVALGYEVNVQLRPGEKLIRNWGNKGLDVNQLDGRKPAAILSSTPSNERGDLAYAKKFGDLTDGRAGNGTLEYNAPLTRPDFLNSVFSADNVSNAIGGGNAALYAKDSTKPASLVLRMPSSYVYLSGELALNAVVGNGGSIDVSLSENNGLDWKPLATITTAGDQKIDLKPFVARRYDYRLKFVFKGPGTGLNALAISHDIQNSQRTLPILDQGDTKISFSTGPQEGTITLHGNVSKTDTAKAKNLVFNEFHPKYDNVDPAGLKVQKGTGTVTVPVETPGDMTRLRMGIFYRANDASDSWTAEASFDNGKTFTPIATMQGPAKGDSKYLVFDKVPANTRSALVRLTGKAHAPDNVFIRDLRIDADYKEPHGGFAPIKVTYAYEENGEAKTNVHVATSPSDTYTIHCDSKPKMKSITLELAQ
jgi:hypothetical protein